MRYSRKLRRTAESASISSSTLDNRHPYFLLLCYPHCRIKYALPRANSLCQPRPCRPGPRRWGGPPPATPERSYSPKCQNTRTTARWVGTMSHCGFCPVRLLAWLWSIAGLGGEHPWSALRVMGPVASRIRKSPWKRTRGIALAL